jgi:hypothetical protein
MKSTSAVAATASPAKQLAGFIAKFDSKVAKSISTKQRPRRRGQEAA